MKIAHAAALGFTAQPGGRLYALAAHQVGRKYDRLGGPFTYEGVYCSADLGRTWRRGFCDAPAGAGPRR